MASSQSIERLVESARDADRPLDLRSTRAACREALSQIDINMKSAVESGDVTAIAFNAEYLFVWTFIEQRARYLERLSLLRKQLGQAGGNRFFGGVCYKAAMRLVFQVEGNIATATDENFKMLENLDKLAEGSS